MPPSSDIKLQQELVFIHKNASTWKANLTSKNIDENLSHIKDGRDAWIISTYLALKNKSLNVHLSEVFKEGSICICHYDDLINIDYPVNSFVIVIRADRPRSFLCDLEVVQCSAAIEHKNSFYLPHWQQPNLLPRDQNRREKIKNLGYFGLYKNLSAQFKTKEFENKLESLGAKLMILDKPNQWTDYRCIDLVLAVRDGSEYFLSSKPPTKLFNAWLAGCPILVGNEPAYHYYYTAQLDYIEIKDADDTINSIAFLIENPETYLSMIENGLNRSLSINRDATTEKWIAFFIYTVLPKYTSWKKNTTKKNKINYYIKNTLSKVRSFLRGNLYTRGYDDNGNPQTPHLIRQLLRKTEKFFFSFIDS